jgi:hypothetical protein
LKTFRGFIFQGEIMFKKSIQSFGARKMMLTLTLVVILASLASTVSASNPILTRFLGDPAPYFFNGKVYMYNTDDQVNSGTTWDSKSWRAYSSTDLVNWTDEGAFWKVGSGGFTWASNWAWAPSAATRNGLYYIYLPVDAALNTSGNAKIGVLRCTTPTSGCSDPLGGPLIQEGREANTGSEPIDPQIFIDDDAAQTPYLFFGGNRGLKVVKLNTDMIHLNGSITNVTAQGFAESAWITKRNGTYYLSYSTGWPGPIQYSTSTNIMGPWTFRGTILPSQNTNTNHQGIVNYNNQWFLFYQRGSVSGWSNYRRNISIECLYFNADGTIQQVTTTSGGVTSTSCGGGVTPTPTRTSTPTTGPVVTPTRTPTPSAGGVTYQAENASFGGGVTIDSNNAGFNGTGFANFPASGGFVEYQNADGGSGGSKTLQFRFALGTTTARTGQLIVNGVTQNITFNPTGAWTTWATLNVTVTLNPGTANTIRLQSNGQDLANQDQLTIP